jgi:hypothetical protein
MGVLLQRPSDSSRVCLRRKFNHVDIDLLDDGHPTCTVNAKNLVEFFQWKTGTRLHKEPGWLRTSERYAAR